MKKLLEFIKKLLGSKDSSESSDSSKGFTLIELLIVIAVLGVLAAAVLIAIDPVEQLSRGRDSGRKDAVAQLGRALQAYYTSNGAFPAISATWGTDLVTSGDIKVFPANPGGALSAVLCTGGGLQGIYCYKLVGSNVAVYTRMESRTERNKGTCNNVVADTWYVYTSVAGRAGIVCQTAEPNAGVAYTFY